jgi:hypothetical protein
MIVLVQRIPKIDTILNLLCKSNDTVLHVINMSILYVSFYLTKMTLTVTL